MDCGPVASDGVLRWPVATIDFEASALSPRSYPIEVGVCVWRAPDQPIAGWSTLILPTQAWVEHGDWSEQSAAVHGISREALLGGISPTAAVGALNELLGPASVVWCDGGTADRHWAKALADGASVSPAYTIGDWEELTASFEQLALVRAVRWLQRTPPRHRAREDAERLMKAFARGLRRKHGSSTDLEITGEIAAAGNPDT